MVKLIFALPMLALMTAQVMTSTTTTPHTSPTSSATLTSILSSTATPSPSSSTLVQLGFGSGLNYQFVASNPNAVHEIFCDTKAAVAYALSVNSSLIVMQQLQPYNTQAYTATVVTFFIPTPMTASYRQQVVTSSSRLYNQASTSLEDFVKQINANITTVAGSGQSPSGNISSNSTICS